MGLWKVPTVKRLYYGLSRNSVLFNVGQSSSSHFFFSRVVYLHKIIIMWFLTKHLQLNYIKHETHVLMYISSIIFPKGRYGIRKGIAFQLFFG